MWDYESSDFKKIFSYNNNSYPSTITNIQLVLDIIPREMINSLQKIIVILTQLVLLLLCLYLIIL